MCVTSFGHNEFTVETMFNENFWREKCYPYLKNFYVDLVLAEIYPEDPCDCLSFNPLYVKLARAFITRNNEINFGQNEILEPHDQQVS